jgi:hypothetical protein
MEAKMQTKLWKTVVWWDRKIVFSGETVAENALQAKKRALNAARTKLARSGQMNEVYREMGQAVLYLLKQTPDKPSCRLNVTAGIISDPAYGKVG